MRGPLPRRLYPASKIASLQFMLENWPEFPALIVARVSLLQGLRRVGLSG